MIGNRMIFLLALMMLGTAARAWDWTVYSDSERGTEPWTHAY